MADKKYIQLCENFRKATRDGHNASAKRIATKIAKYHNGGKPICPECGFKIRGPNHAEGDHHKSGGIQP